MYCISDVIGLLSEFPELYCYVCALIHIIPLLLTRTILYYYYYYYYYYIYYDLCDLILHCDNVRLVSSPILLISLIILSILTVQSPSSSICPLLLFLLLLLLFPQSPIVMICQMIRRVARYVDLAYRKVHPLCNKYSIQSVNMRSMLICLNKCKFENPSWHFIRAKRAESFTLYLVHDIFTYDILYMIYICIHIWYILTTFWRFSGKNKGWSITVVWGENDKRRE